MLRRAGKAPNLSHTQGHSESHSRVTLIDRPQFALSVTLKEPVMAVTQVRSVRLPKTTWEALAKAGLSPRRVLQFIADNPDLVIDDVKAAMVVTHQEPERLKSTRKCEAISVPAAPLAPSAAPPARKMPLRIVRPAL